MTIDAQALPLTGNDNWVHVIWVQSMAVEPFSLFVCCLCFFFPSFKNMIYKCWPGKLKRLPRSSN